jgi:hypothetical protein
MTVVNNKNRATSNSMMGATSLTHVSNPAVAPLYLDTTNILSSNKVNKAYGKGGPQTDDASYGEEELPQKENSSMLMGMGVVATQHIREEYDEEYDDEEDYSGLHLVAEPEGGGASSGAMNTHGNQTNNQGGRNQMAVGEVVLNNGVSRFNQDDQDDESNINSDEQDEYFDTSQ